MPISSAPSPGPPACRRHASWRCRPGRCVSPPRSPCCPGCCASPASPASPATSDVKQSCAERDPQREEPLPQAGEGEFLAVYDRLDPSDLPELYVARARTTGNAVAYAVVRAELREQVVNLIQAKAPLLITVRHKPRPDGTGVYAGITSARLDEELSA